MDTITIANRPIGPGHPSFIIAELSANHNHDLARAKRIVEAAADAGADAIKLQTYTADTLTFDSDSAEFRVDGTIWEGKTLYQLYQEASLPWAWHKPLMDHARNLGLLAFSTPFDATAIEFLESLDVPAYKIASSELVDIPLIRRVAGLGKPMIISTGMGTLSEIDEAVQTARAAGCDQIILLKCTAAYPAPIDEANLATLPHMAQLFGTVVGLSDHTPGSIAPVAATVLGGCVIEKHLTLSRADGGPDSAFSMEPQEFAAMVADVRAAERAIGQIRYEPTTQEMRSRDFRRSLFAVRDIPAGTPFTPENLRSIRPATGLHTRHYDSLLQSRASTHIKAGTPLSWGLVAQ
ncbi:N-acetylneuraminate synthase [Roseovarius halotolerans]|uniref:Pseudaminic acid synthase n=1 Tax=Roseovarius halotolerans TaxID=505353 RepID=A0A1X6Z445_9RHOB|nr:pseudaminic acid synthase [Roseovarius halotolerans]RKT32217.1 N-acetylneuraminate synthase [Roseovarius halotolerans]SLN40154.1 Pseudaminic acid synthase [Roseovarius halotolerans]